MQKNTKLNQSVIYLFLSIAALVLLFPFYYTVIHSFQPKGFISDTVRLDILPQKWSFENWIIAWGKVDLSTGFKNSLIVSIFSTALSGIIAMFIGYVLSKKNFKGRDGIFWAFLTAMIVPSEVLLIPLFFISLTLHMNNTLIALIYPGLINVFGIFVAKQFMMTIPDSYIESAVIDGAGDFRIFARIVMPMAQSALATFCIIQFAGSWNEYLWPMVVIADSDKFTIQLCLSRLVLGVGASQSLSDIEYFGILRDGAVILTILPIAIVFFIFQRRFVEGLTLSGIKG